MAPDGPTEIITGPGKHFMIPLFFYWLVLPLRLVFKPHLKSASEVWVASGHQGSIVVVCNTPNVKIIKKKLNKVFDHSAMTENSRVISEGGISASPRKRLLDYS